jgi:hypothetical protein
MFINSLSSLSQISNRKSKFLLAKLHMESLLGEPTIGDLEIALMDLHYGEARLDDTYMQAVERIGNQPKGYRDLARRTLTWLTYSKRALSLPEIQHALAARTGVTGLDEKFIADAVTLGSICAGLIIVDQKTGIINFAHYTAKEYFKRTCEFSEEKVDISAPVSRIFRWEFSMVGFAQPMTLLSHGYATIPFMTMPHGTGDIMLEKHLEGQN